MADIFKKVCYFFINFVPSKNIRHSLRNCYNLHFCLSAIPMNAIRKKKQFLKHSDMYNSVAIGSSHCEASFNPEYMDVPSFNFGLNSSDNFTMYEIYRNIIKNTKVKNVIVFYDVFSRGSNNTKPTEYRESFLPLKYILGVNYPDEDNNARRLCHKFYNSFIETDENYNGFIPLTNKVVDSNTLKTRCDSHLKLWRRGGENDWLLKLAKECVSEGKNFIFVISPAQKCYKNNMPDSDTLFGEMLKEICKITPYAGKNYNYYDTDTFENESLWLDADHLNLKGSSVFTKVLNDQMKQDNLLQIIV